jgi:transcription initiation factor TFIID TATA-box-binding protein
MELKISNITATANVGERLDLPELSRLLWNVEYKPKRFNALILRTRKPRVTALLFHTGRIVIVGARSEEESRSGAEKVTKLIGRATKKKHYQMKDFSIQNIAASSSVHFRVSLEELCASKPEFTFYEPDLFTPACQLRYKKDEKLLALIFRTGKIIYTGTTDYKSIEDFHSYVRRYLLRFKERVRSIKR